MAAAMSWEISLGLIAICVVIYAFKKADTMSLESLVVISGCISIYIAFLLKSTHAAIYDLKQQIHELRLALEERGVRRH